jgi:hypothetical protein
MGSHRAIATPKEADQAASVDKETNIGWHLLSTQEWL